MKKTDASLDNEVSSGEINFSIALGATNDFIKHTSLDRNLKIDILSGSGSRNVVSFVGLILVVVLLMF